MASFAQCQSWVVLVLSLKDQSAKLCSAVFLSLWGDPPRNTLYGYILLSQNVTAMLVDGSFLCNPSQCHLDLCLNKCQRPPHECSHYDSWHRDPAVTARQAPPLGLSLRLNRSQIQLYITHTRHIMDSI